MKKLTIIQLMGQSDHALLLQVQQNRNTAGIGLYDSMILIGKILPLVKDSK